MIFPLIQQNQDDISKHYDSLDTIYREIWGEHLHHGLWLTGNESVNNAVIQLIEYLVEKTNVKLGNRVLDVGCGYGATSRLLAERWGANVTGLTISEDQFLYASRLQKDSSGPEYLLCDWLHNHLPPDSFDQVISIESSEHMIDKPLFFREANRVLRTGGRLAIYSWVTAESPRLWEIKYLLEPICREGRLPSLGSIEDYKTWINQAGFKETYSEDLTKQVKRTWQVCGYRVCKGLFTNVNLRRYMLSKTSTDRDFIKTVFRMIVAYYTNCMHYQLFIAEKK